MGEINDRIRELVREKPDTKFTKLGEAAGVTRSAASMWAREKNPTTPGHEHLEAIATYFGANHAWLATGKGPKRPFNEALTRDAESSPVEDTLEVNQNMNTADKVFDALTRLAGRIDRGDERILDLERRVRALEAGAQPRPQRVRKT